MGGSGSSGEITIPDYIRAGHYMWLTGWDDEAGAADNPRDALAGRSLGEILGSGDGPVAVKQNPYTVGYDSGPFGGTAVNLSSPTPVAQAMDTRITTAGGIKSQVEDADAETDWTSLLAKAVTELDVTDRITQIVASTLAASARDEADSEMALLKASAVKDTGITETTEWQAFMAAVKSKIDEAGFLTEVDFSAIETAARTSADAVYDAAVAAAIGGTGLNEITDWQTLTDTVVTKLKECGVLKNIDIPSLYQLALVEAGDSIEEGILKANEIINNELLKPVVDAYDQRVSYQRARRVNEFTGLMADIGAVQSSAFLMGMALLQAQYQADVDAFDANLSLETYRQAVPLHSQNLTNFFQLGVQASGENIRNRTQLFVQSMQNMVDMLVNRTRFEQALTALFTDLDKAHIAGDLEAERTNKTSRDEMIRQGAIGLVQMFVNKIQYEQTLMRLHSQVFLDILDRELRAAQTNKVQRDQLISGSVDTLRQMGQFNLQAEKEVVNMRNLLTQWEHNSTIEKQQTDWNLRAQAELWPLEVYARAINALTTASTGASFVPNGPSRASQVIGGVLGGAGTGATTGAAIGAAGGPIGAAGGAAIGAVLGGLAGLLG